MLYLGSGCVNNRSLFLFNQRILFMEIKLKKLFIVLLLTIFATTAFAADKFSSKQEKYGYALGMDIGTSLMLQQLNVDADQLAAGLVAAFKGEDTLLSIAEMKQALELLQNEIQQQQKEKLKQLATKNSQLGAAYIEKNGQLPGVVTLKSGLQYRVLTAGTGGQPTIGSTVEVHYRGTTIDGVEFDSSYGRNPASFPVTGVIAGWTEALQLMKEGAKWQLVIPANLAYGERGSAPTIQPNSTLIFEVELLKIK